MIALSSERTHAFVIHETFNDYIKRQGDTAAIQLRGYKQQHTSVALTFRVARWRDSGLG